MSCGLFALMRGDCLLKCGELHRQAGVRHRACGNCRSTFAKGKHMRVRHLAVSITAAAVMGAFGPAFAQTSSTDQSAQPSQPSTSTSGGINVSPNVGVDANVGISNSDVNAGVSANQSATTTNPSSTTNRGAQTSQSSGSGSASDTTS